MSQSIRLALKLMLATGQRKGEILNAQWPDIDLEAGWWTIPAERAKNGMLHRVPLNTTALAILRELQALNLPRPWLFPSPRAGGQKPITAMSVDHAIRRCDFDGLAHFTPHDLRRTVATTLGALGFNRLIQDKVLNHVDRTVGGIYDRHSYDKEKQQALDAWDRRLQEILTERSNGNVITLQRV
jgi:integrase